MINRLDFPRYTYQDYKNWKEDWELIDGYPLQLLPSPAKNHNRVFVNFISQGKISLAQNATNCNCELYAEFDWKINEDTVVRSDIMIVCGDANEDFLNFPPVLIIEILSPNNMKNDRVIKFELYREQGVKYYLMADYLKKTVEVYELIDNIYREVNRNKFTLEKIAK